MDVSAQERSPAGLPSCSLSGTTRHHRMVSWARIDSRCIERRSRRRSPRASGSAPRPADRMRCMTDSFRFSTGETGAGVARCGRCAVRFHRTTVRRVISTTSCVPSLSSWSTHLGLRRSKTFLNTSLPFLRGVHGSAGLLRWLGHCGCTPLRLRLNCFADQPPFAGAWDTGSRD